MDFYYWVEGEVIGLATSTDGGKTFSKVTAGSADNFVVFCTKKATHFSTDLTEVSEIPSQYHEALVNKAIADGYRRPDKEIKMSEHFDALYMIAIKKAKKYAKSDKRRFGRVVPTDF